MNESPMNAERLLELYDNISEAPNAVARLRRFVLDLAVRGKLVEQDPTDEPASILMKAAEALQAQEGVKNKADPVQTSETPFKVPLGWLWTRVGVIALQTGSGSTPRGGKSAYADDGTPFLRSQNVYDDGLQLDDVVFINDETNKKMKRTQVQAKDLLLNITGGSIGRCARIPDEFAGANVSQHVAIIRTAAPGTEDYLHLLVRSPFFQEYVIGEQTGAGRGGLPKNRMDRIPVPLPPLAEQHRIVAKVDELMALCDRLEEARKKREATRDKLTAASLARLTAPDMTQASSGKVETGFPSDDAQTDDSDFPAHAAFALDALPALTTRPDQIKTLRQTILNLAVRGKLVEQDPEDEPAKEALKRLRDARRKLEEQGRILKVRKIPSLDKPVFEAPRGWEWCSLVTICDVVDPNPSHRMPRYVASGGQPFISSQNFIANDGVDYSIGKRVDKTTVEEQMSRFSILEGAFGFSRIGTIGKTRPLSQERNYAISHAVCVVNPVSVADLSMRFLRLAMSTEVILEHAHHGTRSVGVPDLGMGVIRSMGIALPPLTEQHRIVAKVDELMALCDQLEAALTKTDTTRTRLLEALLHEALEPSSNNKEAAE